MAKVKHDRRGRPEKLTLERVTALVELSNRTDRTFKAIAAERHIPYVSMIAALKRHGLSPRASVAADAVETAVVHAETAEDAAA